MTNTHHSDKGEPSAYRIISDFLSTIGPRQAEVIRRCAIPRYIDRDILTLLRERSDGNARTIVLFVQLAKTG
jgi:hypothetical protein